MEVLEEIYKMLDLNTVNLEIFVRILFLENSVKRHSCSAKNSRQVHDLHTSVIHGAILPFSEDFIFTKLRICEVSRK